MINRRTFLMVLSSGSLLAAPLAAEAQRTSGAVRIGWLSTGTGPEMFPHLRDAFRQGLRELGWVEGQNVLIEHRYAGGNPDRLPTLAAELVRLKVDLILAVGTPAAQAARQATTTIPIVMTWVADPVSSGLVTSLARPGGNVTGLSAFGPAGLVKTLELLKEAAPAISRVAVFRDPMNPSHGLLDNDLDAAAKALRVVLQPIDVRTAGDLDGALAATLRQRAEAVLLYPLRIAPPDLQRIVDFLTKHRLPSSFMTRQFVDLGGLMSYGASIPEMFRRTAIYVDRILKGAKPADLPVEQPTKFELFINLKTAKALGLTIPPLLLLRADEVIE